MRQILAVALVLALPAAAAAQVAPPDPIGRARSLYNAGDYDGAIAAAAEARATAGLADAAGVVLARAHLERHRLGEHPDDLAAARAALQRVDPGRLTPADLVEFHVATGLALYLEESFSAAAEFFDTALARADAAGAGPVNRELLFEWWAASLDRQAQLAPDADRVPIYARIVERAERELARDERTAVAVYWLAAGARGAGDLERAWGAAVAGWIRAATLGPRGAALRADLDRLVTQVILPERARRLAGGGDAVAALAALEAAWEDVKRRWSGATRATP